MTVKILQPELFVIGFVGILITYLLNTPPSIIVKSQPIESNPNINYFSISTCKKM
jgi:hypothetical protein